MLTALVHFVSPDFGIGKLQQDSNSCGRGRLTCSCCWSASRFAWAASSSLLSWMVFFMCRNLSRVTKPTVESLKACSSSCKPCNSQRCHTPQPVLSSLLISALPNTQTHSAMLLLCA